MSWPFMVRRCDVDIGRVVHGGLYMWTDKQNGYSIHGCTDHPLRMAAHTITYCSCNNIVRHTILTQQNNVKNGNSITKIYISCYHTHNDSHIVCVDDINTTSIYRGLGHLEQCYCCSIIHDRTHIYTCVYTSIHVHTMSSNDRKTSAH